MTETKHNENDKEQRESTSAPAPDEETRTETSPEGPDEPTADTADDTAADIDKQLLIVKEQLLRKAAEFENYKKRSESEIQNIVRYANENLVRSVLPIIDDLERSLKAGKTVDDVASFHKGVEMIYQKLQKVLESHGVTPLDTAGKPFDVHYHDAMMQIPKEDVEPNTVLEEVEKGYAMNGKVIRHAKVIVSAPVPEDQDGKGESE